MIPAKRQGEPLSVMRMGFDFKARSKKTALKRALPAIVDQNNR